MEQGHEMPSDDLSALAWVQEELRRALEAAHKALRRQVRERESQFGADVDAIDPAVLRSARAQLHQAAGALELVGLPAAATLLHASESAVQKFVARPNKLDVAAVEAIERASFALLEYLARLLAGKPVSPVAMFPQYLALQTLAGAERAHPADLWPHQWSWRELPAEGGVEPRAADASAHAEMEARLLDLLRGGRPETAAGLSDLFAGLGAASSEPQSATLWRLAAGLYEAQAQRLFEPDNYSKRAGSRLLAQLRAVERGSSAAVSERLAQDLLFLCAQCDSPGDGRGAPRLAAVRQAYGLAQHVPVDYNASRLGRFDPGWVAQARKRVALAKDAWSAVAGSELHRIDGLHEQFALLGDSIRRLYPSGELLADELLRAASLTVQRQAAPEAALAMEVATAVLYLEASLDEGELDHPQLGLRIERLAGRVAAVREGHRADPLEPWMEELYRRVSDRQTMGSVVQELRASLAEAEKHIDQYFRDPTDTQVLVPVPNQLAAMRGVLSVLGMEQASAAVLRMRDEVDALIAARADAGSNAASTQGAVFERLAGNLGALSFLIDMLSVQPQLAKSLFGFDAEAGVLSPVMGRRQDRLHAAADAVEVIMPVEPRLVEQAQSLAVAAIREDVADATVAHDLAQLSKDALAADLPALAATAAAAQAALERAEDEFDASAAREQLALAMNDFVVSTSQPVGLDIVALPATASGLEDDAEMREVFLDEAREVMQGARDSLAALGRDPADLEHLTTVRRAFHTLKGSARMVGLADFGEAAWACEQLYNARLAEAPRADEPLLGSTREAFAYLGDWVERIAAGAPIAHASGDVRAAADALRLQGKRRALPLPGEATPREPAQEPAAAPAAPLPLDLPSAADLELAVGDPLHLELRALDALPAAPAFEVAPALPIAEELEPADEASAKTIPLPTLNERVPAPIAEAIERIDLDLEHLDVDLGAAAAPDDDGVKVVGPLRIALALFNIFLNEADELSRRLGVELAEWAMELHRPVGEEAVAIAHSLAGNSSTVGFAELSQLARALEHALARSHALGRGDAGEASLFVEVGEDIRRLLHQFAAGFLQSPRPELLQRLAEHEIDSARRLEAKHQAASASAFGALGQAELKRFAPLAEDAGLAVRQPRPDALDADDDVDAVDAVDAELFPIFEEEGEELLPQLASRLRDWAGRAEDPALAAACMRTLHTLKGGARLAGAMRLGELAHRLETAIEHLLGRGDARVEDVEPLLARADALAAQFESLRRGESVLEPAPIATAAMPAAEPAPPAAAAMPAAEPAPPAAAAIPAAEPAPHVAIAIPPAAAAPSAEAAPMPAEAVPAPQHIETGPAPAAAPEIDWSRFVVGVPARPRATPQPAAAASQATVRVRAPLLERLVNQAGEVSITRSRIESEVGQLKTSLVDLTENLERLRGQLRDIELQAETQMASRMEATKAASETFDPLEFDRFTRFQELTRMMAESVNDVATVQRTLQRTLEATEDELAAQSRLTRDLQDDLLRTRMVEFESLSERLYRVVRQAAKETGKQVRLDIVGGSIEIDRGVLDRMTGAFEHLLRNCVAHGIESPEARVAAGKDATGSITVALSHEGNEVGVEFRDDGQGLDLARIRDKGVASGALDANAEHGEAELANLIFTPGFSTADSVTELAGRGVGMDVVRFEVNAMGGRIETATARGQGTSFRLVLPLTTAVTQVVMLRCGRTTVAVPSTLVEMVRRATPAEVERAYESGVFALGEIAVPFFWLGALLQLGARGGEAGRSLPLAVIRSAQQRIVVHIDEVLGNQEVVVKHLGPQLSHLPGLAGMTLLASGLPALIYNPVALATLYGGAARSATVAALHGQAPAEARPSDEATARPLVLVVDDSLTVRRVTQRLLLREGYRVSLAKDGLDALERLAEEKPDVVLSDIEMPRMDGFDLVRNLRGDSRWRELPVIMITSRIAQKHRDHAVELGVNHYLGKPYAEEDLLALIARYVEAETIA
jgi:chemosensory pili system protein ChpA (sensor histidine kinase/response regulator)